MQDLVDTTFVTELVGANACSLSTAALEASELSDGGAALAGGVLGFRTGAADGQGFAVVSPDHRAPRVSSSTVTVIRGY